MKVSRHMVVLVALLTCVTQPASVMGEADAFSSTENSESPKYNISTVTKYGDRYYDIAQATTEELTMDVNLDSVKGVTATEGSLCIVKKLVLVGYIVDKDIFSCNFESLEMTDTRFHCTQNMTWLSSHVNEADYGKYHCEEIHCWGTSKFTEYSLYSRCSLASGLAVWEKYQEEKCPQACQSCDWFFKKDIFDVVSINCDSANLTDSTLPRLPRNVHILSLSLNKLRSTRTLFDHLKNQTKLRLLNLNGNEITAIPTLPHHFLPSLDHINLESNRIEELDPEVLPLLLTRSGFAITLKGNPFRCGCNLYQLNKVILQRFGESLTVDDTSLLTCVNDTTNDTMPLKFLNGEGCDESSFTIDYWLLLNVVLVSLNVLMIYFILDLVLILTNFKGIKSSQRPKMDYVICWMKNGLTYVVRSCGGSAVQEHEVEEDVEDSELVNNRSCNRDSFVVRRRTPCPSFD